MPAPVSSFTFHSWVNLVTARLGHKIALLSLSRYTRTKENQFIDRGLSDSAMVGGDMPPFNLSVLDPFSVDLLHQRPNNQQTKLSQQQTGGKSSDTAQTAFSHQFLKPVAPPRALAILFPLSCFVNSLFFCYTCMLFDCPGQEAVRHVQGSLTSLGPTEVYTCWNNMTPNHIVWF